MRKRRIGRTGSDVARGGTRVLAAAILSALMFAANVFSQGGADTVRVLFRVAPANGLSTVEVGIGGNKLGGCVSIGESLSVTPKESGRDTVRLVFSLDNTSIRHGQEMRNIPAAVSHNRGNITLRLHSQSYQNAMISLYSVNGKRILRGKISSANGTIDLSRRNVAPGAYLLSVKDKGGNSFATKLAHNGGKLNISAAFTDEKFSLSKQTAVGDCGYFLELSADGFHDTIITVNAGQSNIVNLGAITLRKDNSPPDIGEIGSVGCSREGLINAANLYLKAMEAGDHTLMPLTSNARYVENDNQASMNRDRVIAFGEGLWKSRLTPDFYRHFADVDSCASFSEIVYSTTNPQYINTVRVKVSGDKISEVFAVVTQAGDWLFNAPNYKRYSEQEDWGELPENQRLSRKELLDGAEAYFKYFSDKSVEAPWGIPCARLEGGAYTGNSANSTCNVGVPDLSMRISTIWHLADVNHGMVVLYVYFGGPDTHMFRILPTGYRYIHTLTAMKQSDFQGMPPLSE